jgi:serine/threonine-protein kinase
MPGSEPKILAGRYRLSRKIGSGGMAVVWLAGDERLERRVAVKVLSDALAADPTYRRRFEREARIAAKITHPNLVQVYDYGSSEERPYLVMEYVEGETLASRLKRTQLSRREAERLARELLGALAAIHSGGIVHRDVKPANILLDRGGAARLTDFGIARLAGATDLTQTGQVMGTLRYMAPEIRGGEPATPRSDLYSSGIVLGESLPAGESDWLAALTSRLRQQEPAGRPRSAKEALAISPTSEEPSLQLPDTAPLGAGTEPTEPLRKRRIGRGIAAMAGLAAVAAGAALAIALSAGGGNPATTPSPPGRSQANQRAASPPTETVTETISTQGGTRSPPAAAPPLAPAPASDPCSRFDEQKKALDAEEHALDQRYKDDPAAQKAAHTRLDEQKHVLDEQKAACKK